MKIRKAILTGGGRATRLHPITTTINKHLLPLANKPMIFHAIEKVVEAGIEEIFINTNPGETELQKHIGDGGRWGVKIKFFEQTGGPQGIAHVVDQAKHLIGDEPFMFYLSDNILLGGVKEMVQKFEEGDHDCMMALSEVENASQFGVPVFDSNNLLVDTLEKPEDPPNNFAITGIYLFGPKLFFNAFENIEPSARGEYEIPSIFSYLLKDGKRVGHKEITGWWKDTGKPKDLLLANQLLLDHMKEDKVQIGNGAKVGDNVEINGPVIIGDSAELENCTVGPYATIGMGAKIKNARVEHSLLLDHVTIDAPVYVKDSIIGKGASVTSRTDLMDQPRKIIIGDKTVLEL